jgi:hypothetical protein
MVKKAIGLCMLFLGTIITLYGLIILLFSYLIPVTYLVIGIGLVIVGGVLTSSGAASEAKKIRMEKEERKRGHLAEQRKREQQKEREISDALS